MRPFYSVLGSQVPDFQWTWPEITLHCLSESLRFSLFTPGTSKHWYGGLSIKARISRVVFANGAKARKTWDRMLWVVSSIDFIFCGLMFAWREPERLGILGSGKCHSGQVLGLWCVVNLWFWFWITPLQRCADNSTAGEIFKWKLSLWLQWLLTNLHGLKPWSTQRPTPWSHKLYVFINLAYSCNQHHHQELLQQRESDKWEVGDFRVFGRKWRAWNWWLG